MTLITQQAAVIGRHKRQINGLQYISGPAVLQAFQVLGVMALQDAIAEPCRSSPVIQTLRMVPEYTQLVQNFMSQKSVGIATGSGRVLHHVQLLLVTQ